MNDSEERPEPIETETLITLRYVIAQFESVDRRLATINDRISSLHAAVDQIPVRRADAISPLFANLAMRTQPSAPMRGRVAHTVGGG